MEIEKDSGTNITPCLEKYVKMKEDALLNTDGKTTFNCLKKYIKVRNKKINYKEDTHKLWFLNKIISNLNSMVLGVYHGVSKRMIPLYFSEYEWHYNHRDTKNVLLKISHYLQVSNITTKRMIKHSMDAYTTQRN